MLSESRANWNATAKIQPPRASKPATMQSGAGHREQLSLRNVVEHAATRSILHDYHLGGKTCRIRKSCEAFWGTSCPGSSKTSKSRTMLRCLVSNCIGREVRRGTRSPHHLLKLDFTNHTCHVGSLESGLFEPVLAVLVLASLLFARSSPRWQLGMSLCEKSKISSSQSLRAAESTLPTSRREEIMPIRCSMYTHTMYTHAV